MKDYLRLYARKYTYGCVCVCVRAIMFINRHTYIHSVYTHLFTLYEKLFIAKLGKRLSASLHMSVRSSVCPHGTTWLTLDRFSWNLVLEGFSKICRENSRFIKVWQINEQFTWIPVLCWVVHRIGNVAEKSCEWIKTSILCV